MSKHYLETITANEMPTLEEFKEMLDAMAADGSVVIDLVGTYSKSDPLYIEGKNISNVTFIGN